MSYHFIKERMLERPKKLIMHQKVEKLLRDFYLQDPVQGFRLPPERELAKQFEVSVPTLRKALKRLVAEGSLAQRQGSGTFVKAVAAKSVGILCNIDLAELRYPHSSLLNLSECQRLLRAQGLGVRVYLGNENNGLREGYEVPPEFCRDVEQSSLGGVIALGALPCSSWMSLLESNRIPVVGEGELHRNMVTSDYLGFILRAAKRLVDMGRKRVAYIGSPERPTLESSFSYSGNSAVWNNQTVRRIIEGLGLEIRDEWYHAQWNAHSQGKGWSALREIWTSGNRPEALILESPILVEDVYLAAKECRISIPDELTVVGAWMKDSRTPAPDTMETLYYDIRNISRNLVEMLLEAMKSGTIAKPRRIVDCFSHSESAANKGPCHSAIIHA